MRFPWPMKPDGFAFTDQVSGKAVYYWIDRNGWRWVALSRWSLFRVKAFRQPSGN